MFREIGCLQLRNILKLCTDSESDYIHSSIKRQVYHATLILVERHAA
jgi:hypothetical protein